MTVRYCPQYYIILPDDTSKMLMQDFKGRILPHRHSRTATVTPTPTPPTTTTPFCLFAQSLLQQLKFNCVFRSMKPTERPPTLLPSRPSKTPTARLSQSSSPLWLPSVAINSTCPQQPLRAKTDGMRTLQK